MPSSARQNASTGPHASSSTRLGATANTIWRAAAVSSRSGEADASGVADEENEEADESSMAAMSVTRTESRIRPSSHGTIWQSGQTGINSCHISPPIAQLPRTHLWNVTPSSIVPYIVMPLDPLDPLDALEPEPEPPPAQATHESVSATAASEARKRVMSERPQAENFDFNAVVQPHAERTQNARRTIHRFASILHPAPKRRIPRLARVSAST